jgi:hypothetical protein
MGKKKYKKNEDKTTTSLKLQLCNIYKVVHYVTEFFPKIFENTVCDWILQNSIDELTMRSSNPLLHPFHVPFQKSYFPK